MSNPFNVNAAAPGGIARLVLVNGRTFLVGSPDGSIRGPADGVVFEDLRILSHFEVSIGPRDRPARAETLALSTPSPFEAVAVSRPLPPDREHEPTEYYVHRQWIGRGIRHDIDVHTATTEPIERTVSVTLDTDFAHLFDMKAGVPGTTRSNLDWDGGEGRLIACEAPEHTRHDDGPPRVVLVKCEPAPTRVDTGGKRLEWDVTCAPDARVSVSCEPWWDTDPAGLAFPLDAAPHESVPAMRLDEHRRLAPVVVTEDARLSGAVTQSVADLGALRVFDNEHPDRVVIAAGAPWFMTVFGRDSLLTAWMVMPFLPELVVGTIDTLAELQGFETRPETEEEPGKILHELRRRGPDEAFAHRGCYYGSVDATPLFVMVVAEAVRWGHLARTDLIARWPHVRAAVGWIRTAIARDRAGLLRYRRSTSTGLVNQGWKDSWDGISCDDGRIPEGPLALAEVQGYAYAALRDAVWLAALVGDADPEPLDPEALRTEASELADRFDRAFWDDRRGIYILGRDGGDAPIDALTTNPGHAIWSGIADPDKAARYLDRCMEELFTGWGLRTLAPNSARYNPLSYHNGSVWPHDTALVAAGAHRIGRDDVVATLFDASLDVATHSAGRLPELFAGIHRDEIGVPVPYPSSCSPQAWASASTLLYLRSEVGLHPPDEPAQAPVAGRVVSDRMVSISGIRSHGRRFAARRDGDRWTVEPLATP